LIKHLAIIFRFDSPAPQARTIQFEEPYYNGVGEVKISIMMKLLKLFVWTSVLKETLVHGILSESMLERELKLFPDPKPTQGIDIIDIDRPGIIFDGPVEVDLILVRKGGKKGKGGKRDRQLKFFPDPKPTQGIDIIDIDRPGIIFDGPVEVDLILVEPQPTLAPNTNDSRDVGKGGKGGKGGKRDRQRLRHRN